MTPVDDDELEALAGEYVLGVLESHEREALELRLAMDPELRRRVAWWEERLRPLAEAVPPLEPAPQVWQQIEAAVARTNVTPPSLAVRRRPAPRPGPWQSLALWRTWAAGASLTAAALAGWIFLAPPPPRLIAVLGAPGEPSWLLTAAPREHMFQALPVGPVEAGPRVHELWFLPPDGAPVSLGVLATDGSTRRPVPDAALGRVGPGSTIAVSLEPEGGSPTGQPTGPVLYTGRLIADPGG